MNGATDLSLNPSTSRRLVLRGLVPLYIAATIATLLLHPAAEALWGDTGREWFSSLMINVAIMIPVFVAIGYAFVLPLLAFRNAFLRYGAALLLPLPIWVSLWLGAEFAYGSLGGDVWSLAPAVLLLALSGGFVPVGLVMALGRWRIGFGRPSPIPLGLMDIMAVSAYGAIVFAFIRHSAAFGAFVSSTLAVLAFYSLCGVCVVSALLLAVRLVLTDTGPRLTPLSFADILFSLLLVTATWSLVFLAEPPTRSTHRVWEISAISAVTWAVAAGSAVTIAWLVRLCGLRLTTATSPL